MNRTKHLLAFAISLLLLLSVIPVHAAEIVDSGTCGEDGDNLTWTLDSDGLLTISGSGNMGRYGYGYSDGIGFTTAPWGGSVEKGNRVKKVIIKNGVTSIGDYAFSGCSGLTSVTIPDSVTSIQSYTFRSCSSLTSVTIGNGVTSIEYAVFSGCSSLENIMIPDSVTSIGDRAFVGCSSLENIMIPDSVTSIGDRVFVGCSSVTRMKVAAGNPVYHSAGNCIIETESKTLIAGCKASVIPSDGSVTSIGSSAFYDCSSLTSMTIPDGVTSIGDDAFSGCRGLTSVTISDSVTSIGEAAFFGCSSLTSVTIPNGVTSIGSFAFSDCSSLTSVTIPDSVTSIGVYAFSGCSSLTSVTIPDSVTSIDGNVFRGCSSLTSMEVSAGNPIYHSAGNCIIETESKTLIAGCKASVIPSDGSVTSIGYDAFFGCSGLTSVTIPDSLTSIGDYAFFGCSGLTSVTTPDSVTSIGEAAFSGCSGLTSVTIPDSVTSIGRFAFSGCSSLTSVIIPASVEKIGWNAIPEYTVIYGTAGSYAQTWAEENNRVFVPLGEATVTLSAPAVVNEPAVPVSGFANPGAEVALTVNGKAAGTAQAAANGRWSANVALFGAKDGDSFTVKATVTAEGKTAEKTAAVTYLPDAVVFEDFTMSHSYYTANVRSDDRDAAVRNFTVVPGKAFVFKVKVSNADRVKELFVISTKNGVSKKLALTLDADSGVWLANGRFDDADKNYVPGVLTLEGVDKDGAAFTAGEFKFNFLIDPSGYAYEAVKSNVLAGVTAAIYYKDAAGHELLWNAEPADQLNPVTTLPDGAFAWVVPEGQWQVRLTKDGYNEAESAWMDVPPEHTNVFIPMTRTANPTVKAVNVYADHADVIFDSYMELDSVTAETVTFAGYTGAIAPVDKTETEKGSGVFYATTFRFMPGKGFSGTVNVRVEGAKNYAENEVSAFTGTVKVAAEPKNLTATKTLPLDYGKTAAVELSAENAAGKTVTVTADGAALALDAETLTLDENGKATVTVTAAMPGAETLTFTLDGTTLTAKTSVTVRIPEPAPASLPGDVSGDGEVTAEDARLALRAAVGLETYAAGSVEFLAADASHDGEITSEDARLILRAAVGLETLS